MSNSNRLVRDADGDPDRLRARVLELEERLQTEKVAVAGRLAGGIAHDLNNLLTPILAYGNMVLEDLPPDSPLREYMKEVVQAADRTLAMTKMLQSLRVKSASLAPVDLNDVVRAQLERMKEELGAEISLRADLSADAGQVQGETGGVERAVEELARNAKQAMPAGGVLAVESRRVTEDGETFTLLSVRDEGAGMASETREHMFEPYFSTRPKGQGKGLGLALVAAIVSRAGGRIRCSSEIGAGTEFRLYFRPA